MPSIQKRGQRWYIRFYSRQRSPREKKVSFPASVYSRAQIERKRAELEHAWYEGEFDPWTDPHPSQAGGAASTDLGDAVDAYTAAKKKAGERGERGGWTEKTYRGTAPTLQAFADHAGRRRPLAGLQQADIAAFMHRKDDLRPSTRNTYRRFIRAFLNWCEGEGHVSPKDKPRLPPTVEVTEDVPLYATLDEMRAICKAHLEIFEEGRQNRYVQRARPERYCITEIFRFAFYQGWRRQELVALRRKHIDYRASTLALRSTEAQSKGKRFTEVPLTRPARWVLKPLTRALAPDDYVFGYRNEEGLTRAFKAASDRAVPSKPRLHLHSLRHSCGAFWRKAGMSRAQIQDLLGHADSRSTEVYESIQTGDLSKQFDAAYDALLKRSRADTKTGANALFS